MARLIEFEGRRISVPDDTTDAELQTILGGPTPKDGQYADYWKGKTYNSPNAPGFNPQAPTVYRDQFGEMSVPDMNDAPPGSFALSGAPSLDVAPAAPPRVNASGLPSVVPSRTTPGSTVKPAAPQSLIPTPESAGRALNLGIQDAGRGAANFAGGIVDLPNTILNVPLAGIDAASTFFGGPAVPFRFPVGAGDTIQNAVGGVAQAAGVPMIPWDQRSGSEKTAGNMIDLGTQFGLGGETAALRVPGMIDRVANGVTPAATSAVTRVADAFTRPYLNNTGRAIAVDVGAGAGAGAGKDAVDNYVPEGPWKPAAQLAAEFAGALGGAGATRLGMAATTDMPKAIFNAATTDANVPRNPKTGASFSNADTKRVAEVFQNAITDGGREPNKVASVADTFAQNLEQLKAAQIPPSAMPTSGLISEDPALVNAETDFRVKNRAPFIQRDQNVKNEAASRIDSVRDPNADPTLGGPVTTRVQGARAEAVAPTQQDVTAAQKRADQANQARLTAGAQVGVNAGADVKANASQALDTNIVDNTYVPARAQKNAAFNAVDPERTQMIDAQPVIDAATAVREGINRLGPQGQQMPSEFVQRLEALAPDMVDDGTGQMVNQGGTGQVAVGDLIDLRKYLSTARQTAQQSGNFQLADNIGTLQQAVTEATNAAPGAADALANYGQFRQTFRPSPGDPMADLTKKIDRNPGRGDTPPSATAGRFLSSPEKAAALQRVLGASADPAAGQTAVRDYMMSDFASSVMNPDGSVNPRRATAWVQNNSDVLAQFPALRPQFDRLTAAAQNGEAAWTNASGELRTAQERARAAETDFDHSAAGTLLRGDPRDVAASILGGGYDASRRLDEINAALANDPAAVRGWKAAVAQVFTDRVTKSKIAGGSYEASLAKLNTEFKNNEDLLVKVFSPDEMSTLRQGHSLLSYFEQAGKRSTSGSDTSEKLSGSPVMAALNRASEIALKIRYGVLRGGGHMRNIRLIQASLPQADSSTAELARMAWFDPDLMGYLLGKPVTSKTVSSNPALRAAIIATDTGRQAWGPEDKNGQQ